MTGWFSLKLDYPIKTVFTKGTETMTVEYKNIKAGPLDAALFEVPPGYQKMNTPTMAPEPGTGKKAGK